MKNILFALEIYNFIRYSIQCNLPVREFFLAEVLRSLSRSLYR